MGFSGVCNTSVTEIIWGLSMKVSEKPSYCRKCQQAVVLDPAKKYLGIWSNLIENKKKYRFPPPNLVIHKIKYKMEVITPGFTLNSFTGGVISCQYILPTFILLGRTKCFLILTFASAPNNRLESLMGIFFVHLSQTSLRRRTIALCLLIRNQKNFFLY